MRMLLYLGIAVAMLFIVVAGGWLWMINNVEQPAYQVMRQEGAIELRRYPSLVVAEVTRKGERRESVSAGFRPLANYIFAKERDGATISMTAPVTQQRQPIAMTAPVTQTRPDAVDSDTWTIQFIMPSKYKLQNLPKPASGDVTLKEMPASLRAAIRFSGLATDASISENEKRLLKWIEDNNLRLTGNPVYAYYNDPFTPGPLRRNEVMLQVAPD